MLLEPVMSEIGPQSPDVVAVVRDGDDSWAVQFESGAVVNLACRSAPARLELMVRAGAAPPSSREDVLRALLMFNFLSADTGGARMGLGTEGSAVYLIRDLPESAITKPAVQIAMQALVAVAGKWRHFLERVATHPGDLPPLPPEALFNHA